MRKRLHRNTLGALVLASMLLVLPMADAVVTVEASGSTTAEETAEDTTLSTAQDIGGGYAATGQLTDVGYTAQLYDATNGLITSDANFVLGASNGYIWIGGYGGVVRYNGSEFERLDADQGLTNGRAFFEDSEGKIWVGTNDNGVVVLDDGEQTHYTYKDGLPSSSIRSFAEDLNGTVYIGTTAGISYVDSKGEIQQLSHEQLDNEIINRMTRDAAGNIYGCTKSGLIFRLMNQQIIEVVDGSTLGEASVTTIYADPVSQEKVYIGTDSSHLYYGTFGDSFDSMVDISVDPATSIHWVSAECNRIWITSDDTVGYLDENHEFHTLQQIPMNNSIEMVTSDYQGNLWFASSRQGVMKIVVNNFVDMSAMAGMGGMGGMM